MSGAADTQAVDCEFCAIAAGGEGAADIACQGRSWVAFFPLEPATPGHTLIIPRAHIRDLWEASPEVGSELMRACISVGRVIWDVLEPEGMNLITSAGETAEQTIFHLHLHIVPRWRRDGFGRIWPLETKFKEPDLEGASDKIRAACGSVPGAED